MTGIMKEIILNWISIMAVEKLSEGIEDIKVIEMLNRIVEENVNDNIYFT